VVVVGRLAVQAGQVSVEEGRRRGEIGVLCRRLID
jgi:hypothetical protein